MWELYAMWAWIGTFLLASFECSQLGDAERWAALAAFLVIGIGAFGAVLGGVRSDHADRPRTAAVALAWSGAAAVAIGFTFGRSPWLVLAVGLVWGASVIADSALFSAIVTDVADQRYVGTVVTLQLALGFVLTVTTIWIVPLLVAAAGWPWAFVVLVPGPVPGILSLRALQREDAGRVARPVATT
jgi:MFS family permease